jgi:hypothetical protein
LAGFERAEFFSWHRRSISLMAALSLVNPFECGSPAAAIERARALEDIWPCCMTPPASRQALAGISVEKTKSFRASTAGDGRSGKGSSSPAGFSEAEAKANRGIDRVATEVAVRQSAIDLREHDPGVGIELLGELPIGDERNGVERPMAV